MKLADLEEHRPVILAESQKIFRVQRTRSRPGALIAGPLQLAPIGELAGRFSLANDSVGYFAQTPETAIFESLVRREAALMSISYAADRQLLCLMSSAPIELLDLRPSASTWPVLQSLRFSSTQQLAADAWAHGFEGIAYRSAQHFGRDCYALFGATLGQLRLVWRKALVMPDGTMHAALHAAILGGQIPVVP